MRTGHYAAAICTMIMLTAGCAERFEYQYLYDAPGKGAQDAVSVDAEIGAPDVPLDDVAVDAADAPGDLPPELGPDVFDAIEIATEVLDVFEATPEIGPDVCVPDCEGKACGDDGCGGLCGEESQCDDGQFCNGVESCDPDTGNCLDGDAPVVNDGIECTVDECDEDSDEVTNLPDDEVCADQNPCTVDLCAPDSEESDEAGCTNLAEADGPVDGCDDGNPCTDDLCETGECVSTLLPLEELTVEVEECLCGKDADCDELNDEDLCNGSLYCEPSPDDGDVKVCQVDPATIVVCADEYFCNGPETCAPETGDCVAGIAPELEDNVDCTVDSCDDELDKVVHVPMDELCDDKFFCNGVETCDMFAGCQDGLEPNGEDGIPCTVDECNEALDDFDHTPDDSTCDDGLFCNGPEVCDIDTGCQAGDLPDLSDGIDCTADTCSEEMDTAVHNPNDGLCDDKNECTVDSCDGVDDCQHQALPDGTICKAGQGSWQCITGECVCQPDCTDRQCGSDGCGGSCGDCEEGSECNLEYGLCAWDGWVVVPGGSFLMGSPGDENCHQHYEGPQRPVTISRDLLVSDHELTQDEWLAVVPDGTGNPSYFGPDGELPACTDGECPLEMVNWWDLLHFANLLSEMEGLEKCYALGGCSGTFGAGCGAGETWCSGDFTCTNVIYKGNKCMGYRLPTEAEWEYLARAGTTAAYAYPLPDGGAKNGLCKQCATESNLQDFGWYCTNSLGFTHPVGTLSPNAWGLYDTAGNVAEFCWDHYWTDTYWQGSTIDPMNSGNADSDNRVARGGHFLSWSHVARSAARSFRDRNARVNDAGVRLVRTLPTPVCVPDCTSRECGNNGCGGSCGICETGSCNDQHGLCLTDGWVVVPGGSFVMGTPADEFCREKDEGPQHLVTITRSMLVSDHEVTQDEWMTVTGAPNPSYYGPDGLDPQCTDPDCPVERVDWYEAIHYCNELSAKEGLEECYDVVGCAGTLGGGCNPDIDCTGDYACSSVTFKGLDCTGYRLPTEAEWEYLARAGTSAAYPYPAPDGSDKTDDCSQDAPELQVVDYAWFRNNSGVLTHQMKQKAANAFGLYDMAGNVSEWLWDSNDMEQYDGVSAVDPLGPTGLAAEGIYKKIRGGNSYSGPKRCRSGWRNRSPADSRVRVNGFRVLRSLPGSTCVPDCENRECGDDGCGGSCGTCGAGEQCLEHFGACQPADWVVTPSGSFVMGAGSDEACFQVDEGPQHQVTITRPMLVSDHTVNQGEWEATTGLENPSFSFSAAKCKEADCPVERVNWYEAALYCNTLSKQHGLEQCYELGGCSGTMGGGCAPGLGGCDLDDDAWVYVCQLPTFKGVDCAGFRLPTEAEFEYFARAGTQAPLPYPAPFGGGKSAQECNSHEPHPDPEPNLGPYAWYTYNSQDKVRPVRTKLPNNWGIYDLYGNVTQWVSDSYEYGTVYTEDPVVDPTDDQGQFKRVRGCPFNAIYLNDCRSAARHFTDPDDRSSSLGLRVVRTLLCRNGDTRVCGTDEGTCLAGVQTCQDGIWGNCEGGIEPDPTLCEGIECGGDNGCGGTCGDCAQGFSCDEDLFVCVPGNFAVVEGGDFQMGSPAIETCRGDDEGLPRTVTITRDMLVSDHEVTAAEWERVTGEFSPSYWGSHGALDNQKCITGDCPVERVSWFEAVAYCNRRSLLEGLEPCYELTDCSGDFGTGCDDDAQPSPETDCVGDFECDDVKFANLDCEGYRLPTEAEWEYLARAGTTTAYAFPPPDGSNVTVTADKCQNTCHEEPALNDYAWYCHSAADDWAQPVSLKLPNGFGLYDMMGNVVEFVFDRYVTDYTTLGDIDPVAGYTGSDVPGGRGGPLTTTLGLMRSADRYSHSGYKDRHRHWGFRVVRSIAAK